MQTKGGERICREQLNAQAVVSEYILGNCVVRGKTM